MTDDTPHSRQPITREEAQLIAKEILAEVSTNISKYVGRGVLSMFGKALMLVVIAVALWGWAHMGSVAQPTSSHTTGH
jgi:hypothetical protein